MKNFIFPLVLAISCSMELFAENEFGCANPSENDRDTIIIDGKVIVKDEIGISFNSNIIRNVVTSPEKEANVVVTDKKTGKRYRIYNFDEHFPLFYFAASRLSDGVNLPLSGIGGVSQGNSSYEIGFYLLSENFPINKRNTIALTSAFGFSQTINKLSDSNGFIHASDENGVSGTYFTKMETYSRTWLRTWSLRLPVCIEFQIPTERHRKKLFFSVGPEFEYRLSCLSRGKENGKKRNIEKDLDYNKFGINLMMQMGVDNIGLIARVGLTPLLSDVNMIQNESFMQPTKSIYNSMLTIFIYL